MNFYADGNGSNIGFKELVRTFPSGTPTLDPQETPTLSTTPHSTADLQP